VLPPSRLNEPGAVVLVVGCLPEVLRALAERTVGQLPLVSVTRITSPL
jgi:hypothetical protein